MSKTADEIQSGIDWKSICPHLIAHFSNAWRMEKNFKNYYFHWQF